jgi:hypothetical protein
VFYERSVPSKAFRFLCFGTLFTDTNIWFGTLEGRLTPCKNSGYTGQDNTSILPRPRAAPELEITMF